jgi:hypothetical protein
VASLGLLDLCQLGVAPGLPALTPAKGLTYAEAAGVCLEEHSHAQDAILEVYSPKGHGECTLRWPPVTQQIQNTYYDLMDATEAGACGIAIMTAMKLTGLTVVQQSRKMTGFDYWLANTSDDLFQGARLEISGILSGDENAIKARVKKKAEQTEQSRALGVAAITCVVEFSRPEAHLNVP